jgi:hypothetical protein
MNKWTKWYDSLPEHTQEYLRNQPLWYDVDMFKAAMFGALVGFLIGLLF